MCTRRYAYEELRTATSDFTNLLRTGYLGPVYAGVFPNGQGGNANHILDVYRIRTGQLNQEREALILNVIEIIHRFSQNNTVTLLGYCMENGNYFLVYEHISDLSLRRALHSDINQRPTWHNRVLIMDGVAKALCRMHAYSIAHYNLNAGNILLDGNSVPHIADYNLLELSVFTRMEPEDEDSANEGYFQPVRRGIISFWESDVYAYGVLLLELLTGRQPYDILRPPEEQGLAVWASGRLRNTELLREIVDPTIQAQISDSVLSQFGHLIFMCLQVHPPMEEVYSLLCCIVG